MQTQTPKLEWYAVTLPDGEEVEYEQPAGTSEAVIQELARKDFEKKTIIAKQALIGQKKPYGVTEALQDAGTFGGELWEKTKGAASGLVDLGSIMAGPTPMAIAKGVDLTANIAKGAAVDSVEFLKKAGSSALNAFNARDAALRSELPKRPDGVKQDRFSLLNNAFDATMDTQKNLLGAIPFVGPMLEEPVETAKTSLPRAAAQLIFLAAPFIVSRGAGLVKFPKAKIIPPNPRALARGDTTRLMWEISKFNGSLDDLSKKLATNTEYEKALITTDANALIDEGTAAAKLIAPPVRQQTVVTQHMDTGPLVDLYRVTKTGELEKNPASGKIRLPMQKSGMVGETAIFEDKLPPPRPVSPNIQDASAGLVDEVFGTKAGPPSSAASTKTPIVKTLMKDPETGKMVPTEHPAFGLTDPLVEDAAVTLKRAGDTANLEKLIAGRNMLKDLAENAHLRRIEDALKTDPTTAYRVLFDPKLTVAERAGMRKFLGPETYQAMQSQMVHDFFRSTFDRAADTTVGLEKGVQSGGKALMDALYDPAGQALLATMDPAHASALKEIARIALNTKLPPRVILANIAPFLKKASIRHLIATGVGGALHVSTLNPVAAVAGLVGSEVTMALLARLMTKSEGATNIREFVRAIGTNDFKRITSYGQRIAEQVEREMKRTYGPPTEEQEKENKTNKLLLPPPPGPF